ncbi:DUF4192 domain-containing protein [Nonomuraea sp. M3C6]|uniref:DUF4192 domain-containing protein n=1 Tax=Nonomuraea marmarensis TaxID=3351344 RepID=A0ABW7ADI5_9ACTN
MTETARLSHPIDYLAIVPYLLGFHPTLSVVVLAFRDQALAIGVRYDLPGTLRESANTIAHCLNILTRNQTSEVAVIGYGSSDLADPVLEGLREAIVPTGILIAQLLRCQDNHYWAHPDAGSGTGIPYDLTTSQIAAQAVVAGLCAFPDREAFADCLTPVAGPDRDAIRKATGTARERAARLLPTATPRYWYDEGLARVHDAFASSRASQPLTPEQVAWLGVLLTSVVIRDAAITLTRDYSTPTHITLWSEIVRRVEPGYIAAPATLLAVAAYSAGAGTLAAIAVERALAANPRYTMAQLVDYAVSNGVPPTSIQKMYTPEAAELIEAQVDNCPRAVLPVLPVPVEGW